MRQVIKVTFENVSNPDGKPKSYFIEKEALLASLGYEDDVTPFTGKVVDARSGKETIIINELQDI